MFSIKKNIKSFKYAFKGIWLFFRNENNARIHLFASILVICLGIFLQISLNHWLWITLAIGIVWMAEAFNTAIEKIVDFISPEYNKQAGEIKDLAAGAVIFAALVAFIIGILVFKDPLIELYKDL
jgi:diacylglycerol kinase